MLSVVRVVRIKASQKRLPPKSKSLPEKIHPSKKKKAKASGQGRIAIWAGKTAHWKTQKRKADKRDCAC